MILQQHLPYRPWSDPALNRLPGVQPLGAAPWILRDEAFAGQMAERDRLLLRHRSEVLVDPPGAAADELLATVIEALAADPGYDWELDRNGRSLAIRPDGVAVRLSDDTPMAVLARLVQEDLLIHEKQGDEHVLTGGTLLFPSSWTLAQKVGRPLGRIHLPVPEYGPIAHRVQRMFDTIRAGQPLWRANWLTYRDADLHQPRREGEVKPPLAATGGYLRSERQTFLRLPDSGAVVFGVHTYVLPLEQFAGEPVPWRAG